MHEPDPEPVTLQNLQEFAALVRPFVETERPDVAALRETLRRITRTLLAMPVLVLIGAAFLDHANVNTGVPAPTWASLGIIVTILIFEASVYRTIRAACATMYGRLAARIVPVLGLMPLIGLFILLGLWCDARRRASSTPETSF